MISDNILSPVIISASRATDIPAFYGNEFIECLKKGHLFWTNPFNGQKKNISFQNTRLIVFWTKYPEPFIPYLSKVDDLGLDYYFSFTLNDYEKQNLETKLPALEKRIESFVKLSERIGKQRVIWRFDPLVLLKGETNVALIDRIEKIASDIYKYTEKLVISFVDTHYLKVQRRMAALKMEFKEWDTGTQYSFATELVKRLDKFSLEIATCAEPNPLEEIGISHNKCIDDELIKRIFPHNKPLIEYIRKMTETGNLKDKGQRKFCGCIPSKDIGKYNSCFYNCVYCYAVNKEIKERQNIFE
ncbi:MAG: DUF1848 domain-containing protein [Bacteroidales bacterium]